VNHTAVSSFVVLPKILINYRMRVTDGWKAIGSLAKMRRLFLLLVFSNGSLKLWNYGLLYLGAGRTQVTI
jgi:hypothetical protein